MPPADNLETSATSEVAYTVPIEEEENTSPVQELLVSERKERCREIVDRSMLLIRRPKIIGKGSDALGKTLVAATRGKNAKLVEQLLDRGADPNSKAPPNNATALLEAVRLRDVACMELLLDFGADPELDDNLATAAWYNFPDGVRLLLKRGAKPNHSTERSAMNWACEHDEIEIASTLIRHGASGDDKNSHGITNLCYALRLKNSGIVEELLSYGCDVELKGNDGWSPLNQAIYSKSIDNTKLILEYGADPLLEGPDDSLSLACSRNCPEILKVLLDLKVIRKEFMENALPAAMSHPDCLKLLISHGADVTTSKGLVERAVWARNVESVNILLDNGCDAHEHGIPRPGTFTPDSETALTRACEYGLEEIATLLLSRGADPNVKATSYPLWKSVKYPGVLGKLLAAGADLSKTPGIVAYAVRKSKNVESVTKLLDYGGNPNDMYQWAYELPSTPLAEATKYNVSSAVPVLLAKGADPNLNG